MAATRNERIIYTAVSATIIIIISTFYRYKPNALEDRIERDWNKPERMNIVVVNQNPARSGQWIELHCSGYYDKNMSDPEWTLNATLFPAGQQGVISLPEIKDMDVVDLLCKYRGWNGCQAEEFKLFENPGNDVYYCAKSVSKCSVVFQPDGSVNKNYADRQSTFLGYVPNPDNQEKCSWIDCLVDPATRIIGTRDCCGAKCTPW